jgi:hypothetical protein
MVGEQPSARLRAAAGPVPLELPDVDPLADSKTQPEGYLIIVDPGAETLALTAPLPEGTRVFPVSASPEQLPVYQHYLIGGPGQPSCEVVQVRPEEAATRPAEIWRHAAGTCGANHPAGMPVTPVTVEYVADWELWQAHACPE